MTSKQQREQTNDQTRHELSLKSKKILDLNIDISGLYLLARPSTPDEAQEAVIDKAANGEKLSLEDIKQMDR